MANASLFGAYDIRGLYGRDLDEMFAWRLGRALAQHICPVHSGRFLIGHDSRKSSPALANSLIQGLLESGQIVTATKVASTPRIAWEGIHGDYDCSVSVTASHLSAFHNGFKISTKGGESLNASNGLKIIESLMESQFPSRVGGKIEPYSNSSFNQYIRAIRDTLTTTRKISVAIDGGGGPIGNEISTLFEPIKTVKIYDIELEPSGLFLRRSPNPLDPGALSELSDTVVATKSAFGVAFDGDGDRIVVVDEQGQFVEPDLIAAILAERILQDKPGTKIMYDLRSSKVVAEHIKRLGGKPIKCRVGHSFIRQDMKNEGAILASELSAHYYFADTFCTDNATRTLTELINVVSASEIPLSKMVAQLRHYFASGEVNFTLEDPQTFMQILANRYKSGKQLWLDGLSVEFDDWWFNARISQTEPLLRLCVEASQKSILERRLEELRELINSGG